MPIDDIDICSSIMTDIQSLRTLSDKTKPIDVTTYIVLYVSTIVIL